MVAIRQWDGGRGELVQDGIFLMATGSLVEAR